MAYIDRGSILRTLSTAEPILKKQAEAVIRETLFNPAVQAMQSEFENHPVTQEIEGGIDAQNISKTLVESSHSHMNLFSFIGFEADSNPIEPIRAKLNPTNQDGPKLKYLGKDRENLEFRFKASAPSMNAIENVTPLPWAQGISWATRIEHGIAGLGWFLNAERPNSRSGGGIQVKSQLRPGVQFRARSYLSSIFNNFLRRLKGERGFGP